MEGAIETQRLKLLRLLAGLAVALGFLSTAPVAVGWSRWVRSVVFSVLRRAESAAHSLEFAQACVDAKKCVGQPQHSLPYDPAFEADDEPPSLAVLRRRTNALWRILEDFPRHGHRLLRQSAKRKPNRVVEPAGSRGMRLTLYTRGIFDTSQWQAPGPWHPPEPNRG